MKHLVTAAEMKNYDSYTIEKLGVPSMVLMEHAAIASVEELYKTGGKSSDKWNFDLSKVLCVCSSGNNGGDGFAVARLLFLKGINVDVLFVGNRHKCSAETTQQFLICENYGITIHMNDISVFSSQRYTTIIDAIFGIGLDREVSGKYADVISEINRLTGSSPTQVLSCDIPSGINADSGEVMGVAVAADKTVTFAYNKIGLTIGEGPEYAGEIVIKDIGIYSLEDLPLYKY